MVARKDQQDKGKAAGEDPDIVLPTASPSLSDNSTDGTPAAAKKGEEEGDDLSDEDRQLKQDLEVLVERLTEPDTSLYAPALESLRSLIRTSTSSMTSVPKPLKFLRPHYGVLRAQHKAWPDSDDRKALADILSVLAMTYTPGGEEEEDLVDGKGVVRESLHYRFLGSQEDPGSWGHEYVRHLAAEVGAEYAILLDAESPEEAEASPERRPEGTDRLLALALILVPYFLRHNAEPEAVDLLLEVEAIDKIAPLVDAENFERVCLYILGCVHYLPYPEDLEFLQTAHSIYRTQGRFFEAMKISIRLDDHAMILDDWNACKDEGKRQQLAYLLARQRIQLLPDGGADGDAEGEGISTDGPTPEGVTDCVVETLGNELLSRRFVELAKELDVYTAKKPEDIYKAHLEGSRGGIATTVDSARQNLATSFVNGFVNIGFGNDALISTAPDPNTWIYKNKGMGMLSATASLGLIHLWDVNEGLTALDKYLYSTEEYVKAGALLSIAILSNGVRCPADPALAILSEYVHYEQAIETRIAAISGLGIAYAGTRTSAVLDLLLPLLGDGAASLEVLAFTALSLGQTYAGSAHGDIASSILQVLLELEEAKYGEGAPTPAPVPAPEVEAEETTYGRFLALGLALLYLGRQEEAETTVETLKAFRHPLASVTRVLVDVCAYAGTGNVLKVQEMLHICTDHILPEDEAAAAAEAEGTAAATTAKEEEEDRAAAAVANASTTTTAPATATAPTADDPPRADGDATIKTDGQDTAADHDDAEDGEVTPIRSDRPQAVAVLGIALLAMGEEVSGEMSVRAFSHLMHYGEPVIRRAVPLALGLLHASNPRAQTLDTLSKYSHDSDPHVALHAIFAMGLVGAGSNHARLAQMLRGLAVYYQKDPDCLFMVRISQGLLHMAKGTCSLTPYHANRQILSPAGISGLLSTLINFVDGSSLILGPTYHWMLYQLVSAIHPRFLITLDEHTLEPLPVTVRVGQAVDTVGQAGKPKAITGFQTHTTPVLLGHSERAELATNEYLTLSPDLEGFVLLRKNPEYFEDEEE